MGITDGVGIHGTDDVGSLGCARLARLHADGGRPTSIELYDLVPVGTPIYIG